MGVDRFDQPEVELVYELYVTLNFLQHRVDNECFAPAPAGEEVGIGARYAIEELTKDHIGPLFGVSLKILLQRCSQYKSSRAISTDGNWLFLVDHFPSHTTVHNEICASD